MPCAEHPTNHIIHNHFQKDPNHIIPNLRQKENFELPSNMDAHRKDKSSSSGQSIASTLASTISSSTSPRKLASTHATTVSNPLSLRKLVQDTKRVSHPSDQLPMHFKAPTSSRGTATYAEMVSGQSKTAGRGPKSQRGNRMAGYNRAAIKAKVLAWTPEQEKAFWKRTTGSEECKYII